VVENSIPPVEFHRLLERLLSDVTLEAQIQTLLTEKRGKGEGDLQTISDPLMGYARQLLADLSEQSIDSSLRAETAGFDRVLKQVLSSY